MVRPSGSRPADPDARSDERQRVRRHMAEQRPARCRIGAQAAMLVDRLEVGLQQEVAHRMSDDKDHEVGRPAHGYFRFTASARVPLCQQPLTSGASATR